ncbi:MAG: dihydropteroate synthase [Thermoanaerobaculia bacterium]|nr:dihydropteroate synthase [Thermoanaerobaculia bacterium]
MTRIPLPHDRFLEPGDAPLVMGIVNVTPDSFSDGGVHLRTPDAIESALRMAADGAAIVDVGGESTRPGSDRVGEADEIARVVPVIEGIRRRSDVAISVDTMKAAVAEAALAAGADIVNDVTAMRFDGRMAEVVAASGACVILMHMRGEPKTMQQEIRFDDVVAEVRAELATRRDAAIAAGIAPEAILVDPGLGFGKTFEHNLQILARARELEGLTPVVIGASRKAFVGQLTGRAAGPERMAGSLAAVAAAAAAGAAVVRVHDVRETVDFIEVWRAIRRVSG